MASLQDLVESLQAGGKTRYANPTFGQSPVVDDRRLNLIGPKQDTSGMLPISSPVSAGQPVNNGLMNLIPLLMQQHGSPSGSGPSAPGSAPGSASHWEKVARRMATHKYGYTPEEWRDLDYIISHESNWDPNALNESSGAYGIPQILPSAHPGLGIQDDPKAQLRWLFKYIEGRYGSPEAAYAFKREHGYY